MLKRFREDCRRTASAEEAGARAVKGFFRQQEERMAMRLLAWQYQRQNMTVPGDEEMQRQAAQLVDDAHRIAKQRGRNVLAIMKEMIEDIKKK
jgi:hypothetical protein